MGGSENHLSSAAFTTMMLIAVKLVPMSTATDNPTKAESPKQSEASKTSAARAPWSGERKQAVLGEQVLDLLDLPLALDEVGELQGQIVVPQTPENWRPWELDHRTEVAR